jgi:phage major head subunit gpT-like protein
MIINQANMQGVYKTFSTIFNQAFDSVQAMYDLVAMTVPSTGRSVDYKWLGEFPQMKEWVGDRVIKDLSAFSYTITNKSFESTVGVDRDDIDDDQIGVYTPMIQGLAQAAKQHPDILVWALLAAGFDTECYDGQYFFDTDHLVNGASVSNDGGGGGNPWFLVDLSHPIKPIILQQRKKPEFVALDSPDNPETFMRKKFLYGVDDRKNVGYGLWQLAYGSKDTLDSTNYVAGRSAMMALKRDDGEGNTPLGIKPTHLIVGGTNESAGKDLVEKQNSTGGESNIWYNSTKLVVVPWLT